MNDERTFTVIIHRENDELWAEVLELPGCFGAGATVSELRESVEEGIALYLGDANLTLSWHGDGPDSPADDETRALVSAA